MGFNDKRQQMKIIFKKPKRWQNGDTARWLVYLWLPKFLPNQHGEKSIRWLEYTVIEYVYCNCIAINEWPHWKALRFIDGETNGSRT